MISLVEILKGVSHDSLSQKIQDNLDTLVERINRVREAYATPMSVTSGFRSMEDHLRIYAEKGITDQSKIPMKSQHLSGCAVDIGDASGALKAWVKLNVPLLEEVGLYCEAFEYTPTWVHFQINPPASEKRFFKP